MDELAVRRGDQLPTGAAQGAAQRHRHTTPRVEATLNNQHPRYIHTYIHPAGKTQLAAALSPQGQLARHPGSM